MSDAAWWNEQYRQHGMAAAWADPVPASEAARVQALDIGVSLFDRQPERMDGIVIDYGCGPGRVAVQLAELLLTSHCAGTVLGVDISLEAIRQAQPHDRVAYCPLGDDGIIPLADGQASAAYSLLTFQHMPDDLVVRALGELRRCVGNGPIFVHWSVPDTDDAPVEHGPHDYRRTIEAALDLLDVADPDSSISFTCGTEATPHPWAWTLTMREPL